MRIFNTDDLICPKCGKTGTFAMHTLSPQGTFCVEVITFTTKNTALDMSEGAPSIELSCLGCGNQALAPEFFGDVVQEGNDVCAQ